MKLWERKLLKLNSEETELPGENPHEQRELINSNQKGLQLGFDLTTFLLRSNSSTNWTTMPSQATPSRKFKDITKQINVSFKIMSIGYKSSHAPCEPKQSTCCHVVVWHSFSNKFFIAPETHCIKILSNPPSGCDNRGRQIQSCKQNDTIFAMKLWWETICSFAFNCKITTKN